MNVELGDVSAADADMFFYVSFSVLGEENDDSLAQQQGCFSSLMRPRTFAVVANTQDFGCGRSTRRIPDYGGIQTQNLDEGDIKTEKDVAFHSSESAYASTWFFTYSLRIDVSPSRSQDPQEIPWGCVVDDDATFR